jgi:hypothetical protein
VARGWESKAIEAQQQERQASSGGARAAASTPEDLQRRERRRSLELARARMVGDLERSRAAAHRSMIERAIEHLDRQLRDLGGA